MPESPSMKSTVNSSIGPTSAKKFEMQIAESSVKCMVGDTRPDPHRLDDLVVLNICRSRRWLGVAVGWRWPFHVGWQRNGTHSRPAVEVGISALWPWKTWMKILPPKS